VPKEAEPDNKKERRLTPSLKPATQNKTNLYL
jgi:hypothetical protein